jgi:hypothetical protein
MCGISGLMRLGKRAIRKWQLQIMATELQHRGTDATGFALMEEDGSIHIWKVAYPAWKACALPEFHTWADSVLTDRIRIALVHTRAYTKGSPHINENNHPLYQPDKAGHALEGVIVHNGMVRNDDGLFTVNKNLHGFQRSCATDSDVFRAILDNHGAINKALIKEMQLVEGTAAVAAIHHNSPGKLLLLRDSNPLVLGATADTLAFASTKEALHKVLKPWIKLHNLPMQVHAPDLSFIAMPNETGYIFGPQGLEEHDVFKCNGRGVGGYVKYQKNTNYHSKQETARLAAITEKRYNGADSKGSKTLFSEHPSKGVKDAGTLDPGLFEFVVCPNEQCSKHVELSASDRQLSTIALLACRSCGSNLAGAPDASMQVN